jgi:hypothetical protein
MITGGHASKTARAVAIRCGEAATAPALIALFGQIVASDRVGGWRELSDMQMGPGWTSDSAVFWAGDRPKRSNLAQLTRRGGTSSRKPRPATWPRYGIW